MKFVWHDWRALLPVLLLLLVGSIGLNDVLVYNPDSARYLIWANSLSQIRGFTDLSIAEPFHYVVHAPLYPVLLLPAALLAPSSIIAAKVVTLLLGATLIVLVSVWLSRQVHPLIAMAACLILALHPLAVLFSNQILSDVPFSITVVAAFLAVERLEADAELRLQTLLPLAGILTAAIFLREVGITLMLGTVLYFLAKRKFRAALFIFMVPMIFYLLWFLRNEVLVAGAEHPPLRNSEIFTLHYFTDRQDSLIAELIARLKINSSIYWNQVVDLIFLPQYASSPYGVMNKTLPPFSTVMTVAGPLHLVPGLAVLGSALFGVVRSFKTNRTTPLFLAFAPVYAVLILVYPFNDVRFLFPLLLFELYYGAIGAAFLLRLPWMERHRRTAVSTSIAALIVFMAPNLAWCYAFGRDNAAYRASPVAFYASTVDKVDFPDLLTKPTGEVGAWLRSQNAETAAVLTHWKELTFWHPRGKLTEVNTLIPLDEFERLIRDYRIEYVVSAVGLAGIPEFYAQMALSTQYKFDAVFRISNLEVFRVTAASNTHGVFTPPDFAVDTTQYSPEVRSVWEQQLKNRNHFVDGLQAIADGRIDTAKKILSDLSVKTRGSLLVVLHLAIAHEFASEYDAAQQLLRGLQVVKQSGAFLGHSTDHLEIISLLRRAAWEKNPALKAEYYNVVSIKLWGLGFRRQAFDALAHSLAADRGFFPGYIFGIYFSLQMKDRGAAWTYFRRLESVQPGHPLVAKFSTILSLKDSLDGKLSLSRQSDCHLRIAGALQEAGLEDGAIDELRAWLRKDPGDVKAWKTLSEFYSARFRYAPALWAAREALRLDPGDQELRTSVTHLEERW